MALSSIAHVGRVDGNITRKTAPPLAHFVTGCADRSGSMASMAGAPASQFHEQMLMLAQTAKESGVPTFFTLLTFDDRLEIAFENLDLLNTPTQKLPKLTDFDKWLSPRGMTALYSSGLKALCKLSSAADEYLSKLPREVRALNPEIKTSYVLLTDGADNSSNEGDDIFHRQKLEKMRNNGTMAIFLGANIDAFSYGGNLGFAKQTTVQMTPDFQGASACLRAVSNSLQRATTGDDTQTLDIPSPSNSPPASGILPPSLPSLMPLPMNLGGSPPPLRRFPPRR